MRHETWSISENVRLECYLHEEQSPQRPAMIVCPGGGYMMLTYDEGEPVAMRFFAEGYQAFVLHYPIGEDAAWPNATQAALQAIAKVRENAKLWNIRTDALGILGFSAGAHVAATTGTFFDVSEVTNGLDESIAPPNAMCLIYPVIGAKMPLTGSEQQSTTIVYCDQAVSPDTPPTFLATTYGDTLVSCDQALNMAQALSKHDVPFELHCFQPGNHGALNGGGLPGTETCRNIGLTSWFPLCLDWLADLFGPVSPSSPPPDFGEMEEPPPFSTIRDHMDYYDIQPFVSPQ